jgi:CTP synthase (UTP-ammonia lyase)
VGAPKLSGGGKLRIEPGTLLAGIYQQSELEEEYFCNYEVNPAYLDRFHAAGLRISAWGEDRAIRAIELPDHDFFLATLFQPQLSSSAENPHPVVLAFLRAAAAFRSSRMDCFGERGASPVHV